MNPVSGQSTSYQHDSDTSDTPQNAINTDIDKATKPYLSSEHTDTESGGISGLDEAISDGYDSEHGESSSSSILSNKPPEDMPKSLASLFSRDPSAEPTAPEPNPKIKQLAPFKIIIDDEGDTKDSPRSNNSNDYLQTVDSVAEFDLRHLGTSRFQNRPTSNNKDAHHELSSDSDHDHVSLQDHSDLHTIVEIHNDEQEHGDFGYEQTVFGHYNTDLQNQAAEAVRLAKLKNKRKSKKQAIARTDISLETPWRKFRPAVLRFLAPLRHPIVFLVILGTIGALVGVAMDTFIAYILDLRTFLISLSTTTWLQCFIWIFHMLLFLGFSLFITQVISVQAAGSGIPEMKCILSGIQLGSYLTLKTLLAKILGLSTAIGSGLFVGKEGPFVHTSSIIANQLAKIKFFQIHNNPALKQQMFAAAAAVGVASNFGSPIGGVLFSIEVTSTYYPLRNYWFAFVAATTGGTLFKVLSNISAGQPLLRAYLPTAFPDAIAKANWWEFLVFMAMGLVGGVLSACFILANSKWIKFRRAYASKYKILEYVIYLPGLCLLINYSAYPYTILAALITALITFPLHDVRLGSFAALKDLYQDSPLVPYPHSKLNSDWSDFSVYLSLPIFMFVRMILLIIALSIPVPAGVVIPVLVIGASFGRIFGEAVSYFADGMSLSPGIYAIIGTAAIGSGITHTLSISVILFEITGQLVFALPVIIVVVIAQGVSQKLSVSIFDSISLIRGLPYLPDLSLNTASKTAKDIMEPKVDLFLTMKTSLRDMKEFLKSWAETPNYRATFIPIVDSAETKTLVGTTTHEALLSFVTALQYEINKEKEKRQAKLEQLEAEGRSTQKYLEKQRKRTFDIRKRIKKLIQSAPIQFQLDTPLNQIHLFFITLRLPNAFVTKNGKLVGMITRDALQKSISFGNETVFMNV